MSATALKKEVMVSVFFELCRVLTFLCWRWSASRWLLWWCCPVRCLVVCLVLLWIWRGWALPHTCYTSFGDLIQYLFDYNVCVVFIVGLRLLSILSEYFYLLKDSLNILLQCIARRAWCLIYDKCGGCIHWIQCFDYLSCWSWWRTLRFSVHLPWWMWNNDLKFLISSLIYEIL